MQRYAFASLFLFLPSLVTVADGQEPEAVAVESVAVDGTVPIMIAEQGAGEGPAWDPQLGLLTSGHGGIMRRDLAGKQSVYRKAAGTNGLLFDSRGRLLACEPVARRVTRTNKNGKIKVLTDSYEGKKYNQPNDITVDSKGRIYFSDPRYGPRDDMQILDAEGRAIEGVYRIDRDGSVTQIITHEVERPNGLVVTSDDRFLYVADNNNNDVGGSRKLWRFDLNKDGTLSSQKLLYDWKNGRGPDGMVLDAAGRILVAGGRHVAAPPAENTDMKAGIYVFSPAGKLLEILPTPRDEVTNCTFGGADLKTLFITAGGALWSIQLKTPGQMPWPTSR
jgi:gluconolactonase